MTGELDALREARTYREIVTHLHPGELGLLTRDEANAVITLARSALAAPSTEPTGEGRQSGGCSCDWPGCTGACHTGSTCPCHPDSRQSEGLDPKFVRKLLGDHHRLLQTSARNCSLCWNARAALAAAAPKEEPRE